MKFSIITINLNNSSGLTKTFNSVFNQSFEEYEYIVIDGGSSDESLDVIKLHADRIAYYVSESDRGIYHAINKGLDKANGEYVLILNSGDELFSADTLLEVAEQACGEDIIYGNTLLFNSPHGERILLPPEVLKFNYFLNHGINHQSMFVKRALHLRLGGYDESYKLISDWKFLITCFAFERVTYKYLNLVVAKYDEQGISSLNLDLIKHERSRVLQENFKFFMEDDIVAKKKYLIPKSSHRILNSIKSLIKYFLPHGVVLFFQKIIKNK